VTVIIAPPPLASEEYPDLAQTEGRDTFPILLQRQPFEATCDFRQQLALLRDTLAQAAAELPPHHSATLLLHQLQATIRELISTVEGDQFANAGLPPLTQAQGYYLFHLPIAATGQDIPDTAEVRLYCQRHDHDKRFNPA
jgi:hypothetical protein